MLRSCSEHCNDICQFWILPTGCFNSGPDWKSISISHFYGFFVFMDTCLTSYIADPTWTNVDIWHITYLSTSSCPRRQWNDPFFGLALVHIRILVFHIFQKAYLLNCFSQWRPVAKITDSYLHSILSLHDLEFDEKFENETDDDFQKSDFIRKFRKQSLNLPLKKV